MVSFTNVYINSITIGQIDPVIYASALPGIALDGTTDDTAILQAALSGGGVHLVIDGDCLIDTLELESDTTLELQEFTYTKKPWPNSGRGMFVNKNQVAWPGEPTDENIEIIAPDALINGNRGNGGGGCEPGEGPIVSFPTYNVFVNEDAEVTATVQMFGARNFNMNGTAGHPFTIHDSPCFGIHLANVRGSRVRYYTKTSTPGDTVPGNDAWHLNGGCDDCTVQDVNAFCNDDTVGFCANDGHDIFPGGQEWTVPGAVASGPITNCHATDIHITGGVFSVARFLSADRKCYIDNCSVNGVTADAPVPTGSGRHGILFDRYGITGKGDYRKITLTDLQFDSPQGQVRVLDAFVRQLYVDGIVSTGTNAGAAIVLSGAFVCELIATNCDIENTAIFTYVDASATFLNAFYRSGNALNGATELSGSANGSYTAVEHPGSQVFLEDAFAGSAGTDLIGHTPETGDAWASGGANVYAGSDIDLDGAGFVYSGNASNPSLILNPTTMEGKGFAMRATLKFLTDSGESGLNAYGTSAGEGAVITYDCANNRWAASDPSESTLTTTMAQPAAGAEIELRALIFSGTAGYQYCEYSTDGGVNWMELFGGLITRTTSIPFRPGILFIGASGATTGTHVGNLRVGTINRF